MTTQKSQRGTTIWRLRVPKTLVAKVKQLAQSQKRSVTKQAEMMLEKAVNNGTE